MEATMKMNEQLISQTDRKLMNQEYRFHLFCIILEKEYKVRIPGNWVKLLILKKIVDFGKLYRVVRVCTKTSLNCQVLA